MTYDQIHYVQKFLKNKVDFFEPYHVTEFQAYRNAKAGHTQKVTVQILDAGPEAGDSRYHCIARSDDGKIASGNPAGRLHLLLPTVHWGDLDK